MDTKKSSQALLENYSKLFFQLGLALSLLFVYLALNIKSFDSSINVLENYYTPEAPQEEVPLTQQAKPVKPPPPPPPAPEIIEVVKNDVMVQEVKLQSSETNETESVKPITLSNISEVKEDENVEEDIPFAVIEQTPIYPGCTGTKDELRVCFEDKMTQFVKQHFNVGLAQDLGLSPGIKRIFIQFTIDKNGDITSIRVKAPHKSLEEEAERVIKLLPKMTPGKQRNRSVGVKYMLPIVFKVMD